jgi:hypothetical protein
MTIHPVQQPELALNGAPARISQPSRRHDRLAAATWALSGVVVGVAIVVLGIAAVASVGTSGSHDEWAGYGDIGDSFGVINAVVSGLAPAALAVTLRLQANELALQRHELTLQRHELHRNAETSLRLLHVDLIKSSINDSSLADVWPQLEQEESAPQEVRRQHLYANLIYQHVLLSSNINDSTREQLEKVIQYLFSSPIMRRYWRASSRARLTLVPGTREYVLAKVVDTVCAEYE